jgi:ABC-type phosphonate transport system ATPase subunit
VSDQSYPLSTVKVASNFIGEFKVGDNLVYNAGVLTSLAHANQDGTLNKTIVVQVGSRLEAALAQIIYRAQNFNREGMKNISEADRQQIEGEFSLGLARTAPRCGSAL